MNLWIRVEASIGDSVKVRHFATSLGLTVEAAVGLLVMLWGKVAECAETGDVSKVPNDLLEEWARWRGRRGRFASAFRSAFVVHGKINDWDKHQGKLIERRAKERARWQVRTGKDSAGASSGVSAGVPPGVGSEAGAEHHPPTNEQQTTTTTPTGSTERDVTAGGKPPAAGAAPGYHTRCVIALNRGLRENPLIGSQFNEVSSSQMQGRVDWQEQGIPIEFAERVVREKAATYRPSPRNPQPHSLAYFDRPVKSAWEDQQHAPADPAPRSAAMSLPRL